MNLKNLVVILSLLGLTACSSVDSHVPHKGVAEIATNVYALMDYDFRGIFGSEDSLIERNVLFVDYFASERKKVAVPIEARIHGVGFTGNWAWFYYKFSLADANTPESKRKFSDIVIERDERWGVDFERTFTSQKASGDFENLMKLYELKKSGTITESEYEQQKAKILVTIQHLAPT